MAKNKKESLKAESVEIVNLISEARDMQELVNIMKPIPFSQRTKEMVHAIFAKIEELMPKRK